MTNLTEYSWYYCKMKDGDIEMLERGCDYFLSGNVPLLNNEVESVLAEVPSYEKLEKFRNALADNQIENSNLLIENTKLKKLLRECREFYQKMYSLNIINSCSLSLYDDLKKRINQVLGEE